MANVQSQPNLETLSSISQMAAQAKDLPSLWGPLLDKVLAVLNVDAGSLMILEGNFLIRKAARGLGEIMKEPPIPSSSGGISWRVVKTRQAAVVTDIGQEKVASKTLAEAGFHSLVAVPMMVRGQVIGVMSIFTRDERQFSEADLIFFSIIANQSALAIISIKSAELLGENRQRLSELEALNQISKSISTLFNFEETLYSILASITKMLRADEGLFALFDHQDHLLKGIGPAYGLAANQVWDFRARNDEGIVGQAFCKGIPITAGKIEAETEAILKRAKIRGIKSLIAAPLKVKSQTLGVIQIFSKNENNFNFEDLRLFSILASQAAIVVNSSIMYRQIEEERKKDEALLTSIGDGVLAIDKSQKIIHFNKAGEKITGFLGEEVRGHIFQDMFGLYNREKKPVEMKDSPLREVLEKGQPLVAKDFWLKKRNGTLFPAYLSLAAIYDADNNIMGAIVVFRDITYEFEVEQMKQEIISIATHELRAPITAIKGYLDMILAGDTGGTSGDTKETIQEVAQINQRLADLVDDLLECGRIEQGRMTIKLQAVDLMSLVAQTVRENISLAEDKKLQLTFQDKSLSQVKADPIRLRQILNNLISNAIKYTSEGSIEISAVAKDNEVICQIKDTGIGIKQADQKKLFQKFSRLRTPQTIQITGTGLGLWLTKKLVEMMNGKIWLESSEGQGSTFYFSLPTFVEAARDKSTA